ncbi:ABC transporter substrate-binding protein [Saccharibacillus sp. JS10]|uniref:ABC transporter substrate-binding protein n=1 Tax=Saccharibacillus sp. JS10 TaxID=2950552 RepID=UPI00210A5281|nr:helical backbone metal receptor [Saccharibacillus sp. JS10]MCQ4086800.1 helical backbone metal receptor [Saccharibacillus sp. JS10]
MNVYKVEKKTTEVKTSSSIDSRYAGKWSRPILTGAAALLLTLSLAACGQAQTAEAPKPANQATTQTAPASENAQSSNEVAKTVYPLTLKDATDTEVTFDAAPTKIISLAPSETEALFALGLDEQIVGVTENDDYPEAAKSKPKMGGFELDTEAIVAAQPDIVFVADVTDDATVESLRGLGLKVFKFNPDTLEDVINDMDAYGEITDHQAQATEVTDKMRADIEQVSQAASKIDEADRKNVYLEFSPGWTVGKGEFMDELIRMSGAKNAAADTTGWNEVNSEQIIKQNPDVILYSELSVDPKSIEDRSGWSNIAAVKNHQLFAIEDNLVSRPGPRLTEGLVEVFKAIYPDQLQ